MATKKQIENRKKWFKALRSGKFRQGRGGSLCAKGGRYCCLGVAAEIFRGEDIVVEFDSEGRSYDGESGSAPEYVIKALGLHDDCGTSKSNEMPALTCLNDSDVAKATFKEIADLLESSLGQREYFK